MCGITGFWGPSAPEEALVRRGASMASAMLSRGPDDSGEWASEVDGVCLAFRRLAILDLSPCGHQPMLSRGDRYVIVFNGEIYNFRELKRELEPLGGTFSGGSDTEVILEGVRIWGFDLTVRRLEGMFAIALWDSIDRTLTIARDRVGKKPLYYGEHGGTLMFASELKALTQHPSFVRNVDRDALTVYLRYGYVPTPLSIYSGISKLTPGTYAVFKDMICVSQVTYWDPVEVAKDGQQHLHRMGDAEATLSLDSLLRDAVAHRMVADVPVGAFLSGGLDSSTVVALMQASSTQPVRTFTIGFDVPGYNEAESAKAVAAHLGTDHTEVYVTPGEAREVIPSLADVYDEPFADSSQIPTILVSRLARQSVTVALSGDGGDELFSGYTRYQWASRIWGGLGKMPAPVRSTLISVIQAARPETWDRVYNAVKVAIPRQFHVSSPGDKLHKLAAVAAGTPDELYRGLVSQWKSPDQVALAGREVPTRIDNPLLLRAAPDFTSRMMLTDLMTYLPDDILVKVDRASMSVSLEARCPILDHRVIEWAWKTPMRQKSRDGVSKWILRQVLYQYVPRELVDRPKMGFGVPIGVWLRGPLRAWADDLLDPDAMRRDGFLDPEPIQRIWREHLSGARNEEYRLWVILMFQAWRRRWLS